MRDWTPMPSPRPRVPLAPPRLAALEHPFHERKITALLVEDEHAIALDLEEQLVAAGFQLLGVLAKAEDVVPTTQLLRPDVVLMDIEIGGPIDGITLAEELAVCEQTPVVFLSDRTDEETVRRVVLSGAGGYLVKPCTPSALRGAIEIAVRRGEELVSERERSVWLGTGIDLARLAIVVVQEGTVRFMNAAAETDTGWRRIAKAADRPPWLERIDRAFATSGPDAAEAHVQFDRADGAVGVDVRRQAAGRAAVYVWRHGGEPITGSGASGRSATPRPPSRGRSPGGTGRSGG